MEWSELRSGLLTVFRPLHMDSHLQRNVHLKKRSLLSLSLEVAHVPEAQPLAGGTASLTLT